MIPRPLARRHLAEALEVLARVLALLGERLFQWR